MLMNVLRAALPASPIENLPLRDPRINPTIYTAIEQRAVIRFLFKGKERIVEPHDYGVHNGIVKLFGYQIAGASSQPLPNWRWFEAGEMSSIDALPQTFPGGRATKTGKHHKWDKLFIRVKQADS
jgi:hypothetical protein